MKDSDRRPPDRERPPLKRELLTKDDGRRIVIYSYEDE